MRIEPRHYHWGWCLLLVAAALLSTLIPIPAAGQPPRRPDAGSPEQTRQDLNLHRMLPVKAPLADMVFVGKTVCSLRRSVGLDRPGIVTQLAVECGQPVEKGDLLVRFQPPAAGAAPSEAGEATSPMMGHALFAAIAGHVLWLHPDLRPGAETQPADPLIIIGVMDPMLIRAPVYEEEALRLSVRDKALAFPESLPGRKFPAQVKRIPWTPLSLEPTQPSFYEVEFEVANPKKELREGMRVLLHVHKPRQR